MSNQPQIEKVHVSNYTPLPFDIFDNPQLQKKAPTLYRQARFLKALGSKERAGFITGAAEDAGIDRTTVYVWRKDPLFEAWFQEVIAGAEKRLQDEAYLGLRKLVLSNNPTVVLRMTEVTHPHLVGRRSSIENSQPVAQQFNQYNFYSFPEEQKREFNETFDVWFERTYGAK